MQRNWYRGFFRLWLAASVLYVIFGAVEIRADYSSHQTMHLIWQIQHDNWIRDHDDWKRKYNEWRDEAIQYDNNGAKFEAQMPEPPDEPVGPPPPHIGEELGALLAVPAGVYVILRTLNWILHGFGS
jgi:hypothetical protein